MAISATLDPEKGEAEYMTSRDDILKQVETTLCDTCYPPTLKEKEILTTILYHMSADTVDFGRCKY